MQCPVLRLDADCRLHRQNIPVFAARFGTDDPAEGFFGTSVGVIGGFRLRPVRDEQEPR
jgi:hypothetical protein